MSAVGDELQHEREGFRRALAAVGPDQPTACGSWTTTDVAVHVASGEMAAGLPSAGARWLVGSGVRADRLAGANTATLARLRTRHGFDWALARLDREPPPVQRSGRIGTVSLLEVWAHHEDIRAVHDVAPRVAEPDLTSVLRVLIRYQRRRLAAFDIRVRSGDLVWFESSTRVGSDEGLDVDADVADLCRWLAGRSPLAARALVGPANACAPLLATTLRL